jgi:bleomycin hydrolase
MGKPAIDISEMYTVRTVYQDKAEKYVRLHGSLNYAQGGACPDLFYVIDRYGAVPQSAYAGLNYGTEGNDHDELEAALKGIVDAVVNKNSGTVTTAWHTGFTGYLDAYLGAEPTSFTFEGKQYTPRSFADKFLGINVKDYVQLTSFTHHPFGSWFAVEVPDNWTWGTSYNVPLEDMMATIDYALANGFTIAWATDVSEKGFSLNNGVAVWPAKKWSDMSAEEKNAVFTGPHEEAVVTQASRQAAFDNYETQDDHGMQIVGKVKDQSGASYYIVKNSWGPRKNAYREGYIYASEAFVRAKTISIMLHKDGLPKATKKAAGL